MRSLMLAAGVALLALNFAGCSCSVSSCGDMGPMGGNCGPTCTTCDSGCDSGCDSCQGGMGMQRPMVMARLRDRLASAGAGASIGDCGCAGSPAPSMGCDTGNCDCGGKSGLGLGLFEKGPSCAAQGCDGNCGGQCGGPMLSGKVRDRLSGLRGNLGSRIGCGMGGCGMDGQLCDGCSGGLGSRLGGLGSKLGALKGCGKLGCGLHGRLCNSCRGGAGSIPHREPQGPGAGQVPSYVYPYYTTRAPRDFLMDNPPTIGY